MRHDHTTQWRKKTRSHRDFQWNVCQSSLADLRNSSRWNRVWVSETRWDEKSSDTHVLTAEKKFKLQWGGNDPYGHVIKYGCKAIEMNGIILTQCANSYADVSKVHTDTKHLRPSNKKLNWFQLHCTCKSALIQEWKLIAVTNLSNYYRVYLRCGFKQVSKSIYLTHLEWLSVQKSSVPMLENTRVVPTRVISTHMSS